MRFCGFLYSLRALCGFLRALCVSLCAFAVKFFISCRKNSISCKRDGISSIARFFGGEGMVLGILLRGELSLFIKKTN